MFHTGQVSPSPVHALPRGQSGFATLYLPRVSATLCILDSCLQARSKGGQEGEDVPPTRATSSTSAQPRSRCKFRYRCIGTNQQQDASTGAVSIGVWAWRTVRMGAHQYACGFESDGFFICRNGFSRTFARTTTSKTCFTWPGIRYVLGRTKTRRSRRSSPSAPWCGQGFGSRSEKFRGAQNGFGHYYIIARLK